MLGIMVAPADGDQNEEEFSSSTSTSTSSSSSAAAEVADVRTAVTKDKHSAAIGPGPAKTVQKVSEKETRDANERVNEGEDEV